MLCDKNYFADFPSIEQPRLETETVVESPYFKVVCKFEMVEGVRYSVTWLAGNETVSDFGPFDEGISSLDSEKLSKYTVGDAVSSSD